MSTSPTMLLPTYVLVVAVVLLILQQPLTHAASLSFDYFCSLAATSDPNNKLLLQGTATRNGSTVLLTQSTQSNAVGRLVYVDPLLGGFTSATTTFETFFTFQIITKPAPYGSAGHGFAFFISNATSVPANSSGEYLGISSPTSSPPFFAVEFDTYKNSYDPSASHIGIDVNTVTTHVAYIDTSSTILSSFNLYGGYIFRAWIRYNSALNNRIQVYLANCGTTDPECSSVGGRPDIPILTANYDLSNIFTAGKPLYFGLSASTGSVNVENVTVFNWALYAENSII